MLRRIVRGAFVVLVPLVFACQKQAPYSGKDPESVLQTYIQRSFSVKSTQDRASLLELMSGPARSRLENWSDEQFQEAFIDSKRKFLKLKFKDSKKVSETEINITYELLYSEKNSKSGSESIVTNKKLCYLTQDQGLWKIQNVKTLKELIEYQNEMSLP